jgi:predicted metal-dependent enzyme (double-stranded beta helix superfamily)
MTIQTAIDQSPTAERASAIAATVDQIRVIERTQGVSQHSLQQIKAALLQLAQRLDLFPLADFPPPAPGGPRASCLYRLSEDDDHRYALYANAALGRYANAPHNHATWAVIVGVYGEEPNRLYRRSTDGGVEHTGDTIVGPGTGVTFMPDDLHSLDIKADTPMLNFHMYGLAIEQLGERRYYAASERAWKHFPPHSDIREARYGKRAV